MAIQLDIDVNARQAMQNLKTFEKGVSKLGDTIETLQGKLLAKKEFLRLEKDTAKIAILNKEIVLLEKEIGRVQNIGKAGFDAFGNAATKSTNAVTAGAHKAFGALRGMALVLPGIGIAGILGFVSEGIASLIGFGDKADETAKRIKEALRPLSEIKDVAIGSSEEELAKVRVLSNVVLDQTESYKKRNAALNELKEINKNYFGDLTLEKGKLEAVKKATDDYTQAIIQQAIIKGFSDEIGKVSVELSKQEREYSKLGETLRQTKKDRESLNGDDFFFQTIEINDATAAYNKQGKAVGSLRTQMFNLRKEIDEAVKLSLDFKPLKETKETKEKVKKQVEELRAEFTKIIGRDNPFGELFFRIKLAELQAENNPSETIGQKLTKELLPKKIEPRINVAPKPVFEIDEIEVKALEFRDKLNGIFQNVFSNGFASIGENIGAAIAAGADPIKAAFDSIGSVIGDLIQQIGKALIEYGVVKTGLDKVLSAGIAIPGAAAIAAGVAAVAIGSLIKNSFKPKAFAQGGLVFGPTVGLIGEGRGTNRNNPEVVAPLDQLQKMLMGSALGGQQLVVLESRISGNDILLSQARTTKKQGRSF